MMRHSNGPSRRAHAQRIRNRAQAKSKRTGAAVVELALVCPFLLVMALGICELGQAYKVDAVLSAASRAGSGSGSRPGCSNVDVISDARSAVTTAGLSASYLTVTILVNDQPGEVANAVHNDKITVTASIPTSKIVVVNTLRFLGVSSVLSQSTTMLRQ